MMARIVAGLNLHLLMHWSYGVPVLQCLHLLPLHSINLTFNNGYLWPTRYILHEQSTTQFTHTITHKPSWQKGAGRQNRETKRRDPVPLQARPTPKKRSKLISAARPGPRPQVSPDAVLRSTSSQPPHFHCQLLNPFPLSHTDTHTYTRRRILLRLRVRACYLLHLFRSFCFSRLSFLRSGGRWSCN